MFFLIYTDQMTACNVKYVTRTNEDSFIHSALSSASFPAAAGRFWQTHCSLPAQHQTADTVNNHLVQHGASFNS